MSPEAQRIAIAQACGLRIPMYDAHNYFKPGGPDMRVDVNALPDYLNSLDAMHEAEKSLSKAVREQLVLVSLAGLIKDYDRYTPDIDKFRVLYFATAAQRAEAFLRTLNLWTTE